MSSPVSTSTITATTLLTLMCVDASVSKNQSEYAHVLGSAWLFFSSGPNRVAHSRRTSMSICSRSNRLSDPRLTPDFRASCTWVSRRSLRRARRRPANAAAISSGIC